MPVRGGMRAPGPGHDRRPGYRGRWSPDYGGPGLDEVMVMIFMEPIPSKWSPAEPIQLSYPLVYLISL